MQVKKVDLSKTCPTADTEPESSEESEIEILVVEGNFIYEVMQIWPSPPIVFIHSFIVNFDLLFKCFGLPRMSVRFGYLSLREWSFN